jgi:AcrR family transcriptional regulator
MLASAVTLMRERGAAATSVDDVLAHSGAPRGSVYHHFPRGRVQLLEEALVTAASSVASVLSEGEHAHPVDVFDRFVKAIGASLAASNYRAGCPVLAVAVDATDDAPQLWTLAANMFRAWCEVFEHQLAQHRAPRARARRLAALAVSAVEGAVVLSRTQRSSQPLEDVRLEVRALIEDATGKGRTKGSHRKAP